MMTACEQPMPRAQRPRNKTLTRASTLAFAGTAEGVLFESVTRTGGTANTLYWIVRHGALALTVVAQVQDLDDGAGDIVAVWRIGVEPVAPGDNIGPALAAWQVQFSGNAYGATISLRVPPGATVQFIVG